MSGEKKVFALNGVRVKLYAPRDLSKNWFFEWYGPQRIRKYGPINRQKTYRARMAAAEAYAKVLEREMLPVKSVAQVRMEEYVTRLEASLRPSTMVNIAWKHSSNTCRPNDTILPTTSTARGCAASLRVSTARAGSAISPD